MVNAMEQHTQENSPLTFAVIATDVVLFTIKDSTLLVRLMRVNRPPHYDNVPGFPGGLIERSETAEDAARRHISFKGMIAADKIYFEQLYTFSEVARDPRGRVIAVAYLGVVPWEHLSPEEQQDTDALWWCPLKSAKGLAYDHNEILALAKKRLATRITYTTLISKIIEKEFTLTKLEHAYESILGTTLDKRNFRKKILKLGIVKEVPGKRESGSFRPAQIYTFSSKNVQEIEVL